MFENISIWYRTDPAAKNKIAFFIGLLVFFPTLIGGIWWLNLPKSSPKTSVIENSIPIRPKITDKNFENSHNNSNF